jgi:hypothetical protein
MDVLMGKPQENHRKTIGKWRFTIFFIYQWIGLRENLNRKPSGFYHQISKVSCKFSHHPIL